MQVIRHKCERDLVFFARYFFKELKAEKFIVSDHHYDIADALQDIEQGGNLLINMPPRYGKTEVAVVMWIARAIALNPSAKFIHLSYSAELALENSSKVREIVKSDKFQQLWPIGIKSDSDSKAKWYTDQGGGLYATQAGGAITGFGAGSTNDSDGFNGAIIIDDPLKPDDARSDLERTKVNERLNNTIKSRRNSRKTPIVIIMQRLHEDDMSGYVLGGGLGEPIKHLCLSARTDDGTALWAHKHTVAELNQMEAADRNVFWSQYMQKPTPQDGDVFRLSWFQRYSVIPDYKMRTVHSWDTAYKAEQHNDPSACTIWRVRDDTNEAYLMHAINERMDYPTLKKKVIEMAGRYPPDAVLIEDKASGQSLIQELKTHTRLPVIARKALADKETRARTAAGTIEAGRALLPTNAPWLSEFERQLTLFPNAKHDDMVDSLSQFINWWRSKDSDDTYAALLKETYGL